MDLNKVYNMDNLKELNGKLKSDGICDYDYQSIYDDEYSY